MGSSFNPQILVDKLAKLNSSQASIETLSHWCIFHMNKAKLVVETWDRQFHCAPREQRLAYLYLANDILQNSRRKGSEFVGEFWKVLPDALRDMIENGDEFGRNAARRLINIWEERKVFGSRGEILKEEFLERQPENGNRNGRHMSTKLKEPVGNTLDKIVSLYDVLYGGQIDEDALLSKCSNAVTYLEKVEKEIGGDLNSGHRNVPVVVKEVQGQDAILKDCIEQLRTVETSRTNLASLLKEALHMQELKLELVHRQLQAAQTQSDRADNLCRQLLNQENSQLATEQTSPEIPTTMPPQGLEQSAPVMYTQQAPSFPQNPNLPEEDPRKSAAAAVAAKLTASTSSAQMLSYVLSSLASEGIIGNPPEKDSPSGDYPSEKRPKLENPQQPAISTTAQETVLPFPAQQQPLVPPFQLPQFLQPLQPPGPINHVPFNYSMSMSVPMPVSATQQQAASVPGYDPTGAQITPEDSSYQNFQASEGFYGTTSASMPMAPISRQ